MRTKQSAVPSRVKLLDDHRKGYVDRQLIAYATLILAGGSMYAPYGSFFALISESYPRNVLDEVLGLINSSGALGGFAGAWFVGLLQARTGNSQAGFLLMSGALIGSGLLMLFYRPDAGRQTGKLAS
jgi:nitrate/nitrite transporter NarK